MIKKITNLLSQLAPNELKLIYDHIKGQYCVEEKKMLRDDILHKVEEIIHTEFWVTGVVEETTVQDMGLEQSSLLILEKPLIEAFELEDISQSTMMEWETVGDIVSYIEDNI